MLTNEYPLANFSNLSEKLDDMSKNINIFKEYSWENQFCYTFNDESLVNVTDVYWLNNSTQQGRLYSLNHIERNTKKKNFISYARGNQCFYTYSMEQLALIKSFELDPVLMLKDQNSTYFEKNLLSQNKLTKELNCIQYGYILSTPQNIPNFFHKLLKFFEYPTNSKRTMAS